MLETKRFGAVGTSMRVKLTLPAGSAFAFCEINTRPVIVAAHSVELLLGARSTAAR